MSLMLILREPETETILPWAERFARARNTALIVARPTEGAADFVLEEIHAPGETAIPPELAALHARLLSMFPVDPNSAEVEGEPASTETAGIPAPDAVPVTLCALPAGDFTEAALRLIESRRPELLLLPRPLAGEGPIRQVFRAATCATVVLDVPPPKEAEGASPATAGRILVPVSSGANARLALDLACALAGTDGRVDALYVEPTIGADAERVGHRIVDREIRRASVGSWGVPGAGDGVRLERRVAISNDVPGAIQELVERVGYDLVLIGASEGLPSPRMRKSSIPDRVRRGVTTTPVGVVRGGLPMAFRLERAVIRVLRGVVPQLSREERVDLVERIQSSSQFNFDFVALVCLSTLIAGLGLLDDSVAVVIGAMLVAPLMTPLVGCGLALVHGNLVLIRNAARSVLLGFILSFALGVLLGLFVPDVEWTEELRSRGSPGPIALFVALVSGIAAAYATARPGLSGAIAGVAIAAALVPPIAAAGIGAALGKSAEAVGALLLFATNIVAIVLGAAMSLYAVGMRGERPPERRTLWIRPLVALLVVATTILAIALGGHAHDFLDVARVSPQLRAEVTTAVEDAGGEMTALEARLEDGTIHVEVEVDAAGAPRKALLTTLEELARKTYDPPVEVRIATRIVLGSE